MRITPHRVVIRVTISLSEILRDENQTIRLSGVFCAETKAVPSDLRSKNTEIFQFSNGFYNSVFITSRIQLTAFVSGPAN